MCYILHVSKVAQKVVKLSVYVLLGILLGF